MKTFAKFLVLPMILLGCGVLFTACSGGFGGQHKHNWGSWFTTGEASCSQVGYQERKCRSQGCFGIDYRDIPKTQHDMTLWSEQTENCLTSGHKQYSCTVCGASDYQTFQPLGHDMGSWSAPSDPTASADGVTTKNCSRCDYFESEIVASRGLEFTPINGGQEYEVHIAKAYYDIIIPTLYNGKLVTSISGNGFLSDSHYRDVYSITFASDSKIEKISADAFRACTYLENIVIPSSVKFIGDNAFRGCTKLKTITFLSANGLETLGDGAFADCKALGTFAISNKITSINASVFSGCENLASLTLNDGNKISNIGEYAFFNCAFSTINLPSTLKTIDRYAFGYCRLTKINFPDGLEQIGYCAFSNTLITSIAFPAGLTEIDYSAFGYCSLLASVSFAAGSRLVSIGNSAFESCIGLTAINLANCTLLETIDQYAFISCSNLEKLVLPMNSPSFETIGTYAFSNCNLGNLEVPRSVSFIGYNAFYACKNLKIKWFYNPNIILYQSNFLVEEAVIGGDITEIYLGLSGITTLKKVSFPDGNFLETIGSSAFQDCTGLEAFEISANIKTIGFDAFKNCTGLTELIIPAGITQILQDAFTGCTKLKITWYFNPSFMPTGAYIPEFSASFRSHISKIIIHENVTAAWNHALSSLGALRNIVIMPNVTSIVSTLFNGCTNLSVKWNYNPTLTSTSFVSFLKEVVIPSNVTTIAANAFKGMTGLKTIVFEGDGLISIGNDAFYGCTELTSIFLPSSVRTIGEYAFGYCTGLTEFVIPQSVTSISHDTFAFCEEILVTWNYNTDLTFTGSSSTTWFRDVLQHIIFPDGMTKINDYLFMQYFNFKSITIPVSLTNLGAGTFNSPGMTDVYYLGTKAQWAAVNKILAMIPTTVTVHCTDGIF